MPPLLRLESVSKVYRMGQVDVRALREVSLEVDQGEMVAIMGASEEKPNVLTVPIEALAKEGGKVFISRVIDDPKGQRTEKIEIVTGARNDRDVEIVSGVEEATKVLLNPPSAAENDTKM